MNQKLENYSKPQVYFCDNEKKTHHYNFSQQSELASGEDSSSLHVTSEHELVASSEPAATTSSAENGDDVTDIAGPSTSMAPAADTAAVAKKVKVTTKKAKKDQKEAELRAEYMFSEFSLRVRKTAAPAEPPK